MVSVAQLVERWIVAPVVVGSIPIAHPGDVPPCLGRTLGSHRIQGLFLAVQFHPNCR